MRPSLIPLPPIHTEVPLREIGPICDHFGLESLWQKIVHDPPTRPFQSDGASCFPDLVGDIDIYPAAFLHDLKYWAGHPGEEAERFIADLELARDVVALCGGSVHLAELMLAGVRLGGSSHLPTPWRWGFGRTTHFHPAQRPSPGHSKESTPCASPSSLAAAVAILPNPSSGVSMHQLVKMTPPPLGRDDRRRNQTGSYQVKTAFHREEQRSEIRADRRVNANRALPRIYFMPVMAWAKRFAWPWVRAQMGL